MNPITSAAPFHSTPIPKNPLVCRWGFPPTTSTGLQTPTLPESKLSKEGELRAQHRSPPGPTGLHPSRLQLLGQQAQGPAGMKPAGPSPERDTLLTLAWLSPQLLSGTPSTPASYWSTRGHTGAVPHPTPRSAGQSGPEALTPFSLCSRLCCLLV